MKISIVSATEMLERTGYNSDIYSRAMDEKFIAKEFVLVEHDDQLLVFDRDEEWVHSADAWLVKKNADFTEGRGPMHFHKLFYHIEDAFNYIMKQDGVYGSVQRTNNYSGISIYGKPYCVSGFNGYDLNPVTIE